MKHGSLPTYFHSSTVNPSAHRVIGNVECKILKADNEVAREAEHEIASILERGSNEMDKDPLPLGKCNRDVRGNAQKPLSYIDADDSIGGTTNESNYMVASSSIANTDRELSEYETVFYTDKAVTRTELPELTICYKDSSSHVVRDICIDEGVPSRGKMFADKGQVDHIKIINIIYSDLVGRGDLMKEGAESCFPSSEDGKFVSSSDKEVDGKFVSSSEKEVEKHRRADNLLEEGLGDVNAAYGIENDILEEKFVPENLLSINNVGPVSDCFISFYLDGQLISGVEHKRETIKGNPKMSIEEAVSNVEAREKILNDTFDEHVMPDKSLLLQERNLDGHHFYSSEFAGPDQQQPNEGHVSNKMDDVDLRPLGTSVGTKLETTIALSANENSLACNNTKDLPYDRRVEKGSITFDFNLSSSTMSAGMEVAETADHQYSAKNSTLSGLEDGALDSLTGSTRSFFIQHGYGESDFSGSVSDSITYSGPIPCSGNISLRSEGSTASTHSFAFPALQSEWNSSPVKMEKADRRQLKRHHGWWIPVLCCKF